MVLCVIRIYSLCRECRLVVHDWVVQCVECYQFGLIEVNFIISNSFGVLSVCVICIPIPIFFSFSPNVYLIVAVDYGVNPSFVSCIMYSPSVPGVPKMFGRVFREVLLCVE